MTDETNSDLVRRHKKVVRLVQVLLVFTLLLIVIAYFGKDHFGHMATSRVDIPLKIFIVIFGLGAVALRRTRFSPMRLQDLGALGGAPALLTALEKTTVQLAVLAGLLAVAGFVATLLTSNDFYTYGAGLIAVVVLLYAYPTQTSWNRTLRRFTPDYEEPTPKNLIV